MCQLRARGRRNLPTTRQRFRPAAPHAAIPGEWGRVNLSRRLARDCRSLHAAELTAALSSATLTTLL
jgi:hypothetical protein